MNINSRQHPGCTVVGENSINKKDLSGQDHVDQISHNFKCKYIYSAVLVY